jgi:hypothetical protein
MDLNKQDTWPDKLLDHLQRLSITKPLGISDEIRMPARMVLIPPLENRKLGRKNHQM